MDLNKFDTSKLAEEGMFLQLEFNGEKLKTEAGEAIGLMVKGSTSADFKSRTRAITKARTERIRMKKNGQIKGLGKEDDENSELYASAVSGYVHIEVDGEVLTDVSIKKTLSLFDQFGWIQDQVIEFVDDDANFVGER